MNKIEKMNQYVSDLSVLNVKFHNLHWNVVGENFEAVHVYIEKLYDDLFLKFDEVAERIKMLGEYPLASLQAHLNNTSVKELENKDVSILNVYQVLQQEMKHLKATALEVRKLADQDDDFVTVSLMEDHVSIYDKEIWFINQTLK